MPGAPIGLRGRSETAKHLSTPISAPSPHPSSSVGGTKGGRISDSLSGMSGKALNAVDKERMDMELRCVFLSNCVMVFVYVVEGGLILDLWVLAKLSAGFWCAILPEKTARFSLGSYSVILNLKCLLQPWIIRQISVTLSIDLHRSDLCTFKVYVFR